MDHLRKPRTINPLRTTAVVFFLAALIVSTGWAASAEADPPTTYYFSPSGSDSASGTSPDAPWRSLSRVAQLPMGAGSRIELQGGAVFTDPGGLTLNAGGASGSPAVVESYGGGAATVASASVSCVSINASAVVVSNVVADTCGYAGFAVGGTDVHIAGVEARGSEVGVFVAGSASGTQVSDSRIHDNTRIDTGSGSDDDSGAFGVLVNGQDTTITGNTISGHDAASPDYGRDGSAVEVFGAQNTVVANNTAADNQTFVEVGGVSGSAESSGVLLQSNHVTSALAGSYFTVVHAGDQFGASSGVHLADNDVNLTGSSTEGVVAGPSCTPGVLAMEDNSVAVTDRAIAVQGTYSTSGDQVSP